jgi:hypothetical protein
MEQLPDNIPHARHTRQNDALLVALPMMLSGIVAVGMCALPARGPRLHPNPAARKRSLVGRGLQALACGDFQRVTQLTQQIEREGLNDV